MARIYVLKDLSGRIIVSFLYHSVLVSKVKTIDDRRWHPTGKYWSFPDFNGILENILKVLGDGGVEIYPALKGTTQFYGLSTPTLPIDGGGRGRG